MDINSNQRLNSRSDRYSQVQRISETRSAEVQDTVSRARRTAESQIEAAKRIGTDSLEISQIARESAADDVAREERLESLRAAAQDGSLFDRGRLERAAERLLGSR